jgi:heme A synthase
MLHRGAALAVGALLLFVLWRGVKKPGLRAVSIATLVALGVQVAVGAVAAITESVLFNGLHVALATLVWAGVLTTALLTLPRTDRAPQLSRLAVEKGFE